MRHPSGTPPFPRVERPVQLSEDGQGHLKLRQEREENQPRRDSFEQESAYLFNSHACGSLQDAEKRFLNPLRDKNKRGIPILLYGTVSSFRTGWTFAPHRREQRISSSRAVRHHQPFPAMNEVGPS